MNERPAPASSSAGPIPADDPGRELTQISPDTDETLPHLGVVGDTYTILVSGQDTAGRYTLIDMHVPPGGGPPPHRHDFEEMFTILDGEIELTFRGATTVAKAGDTAVSYTHLAVAEVERDGLLQAFEQLIDAVARCEDAGQLGHLGPIGAVFVVDAGGVFHRFW